MSGKADNCKVDLVLGYTGSGKSTVGRMIAKLDGGKCIDTSTMIIRDYAEWMGGPEWWVRWTKRWRRAALLEWGQRWKTAEPAAWVEDAMMDGATVVPGIRTIIELDAACQYARRIVWVDRPGVDCGKTDGVTWEDAFKASRRAGVPFYTIHNGSVFGRWRKRLRAEVSRRLGDKA